MEVKVAKLNSANATASANIDKSIIEKKQDKILGSLAKTAKIHGFRPGKVPVNVVKARFGDKVKQDAEQEAIKELFDVAVKELKIEESEIIGEPIFTKFARNDNGIDVELKFSLRPEIKLGGYEKFIPTYEEIQVDKKEIDERVTFFLKQTAPLKKIKDIRALKNGDFALIDFEGFVDDKAFEGGKAEAYTLEIGSGSFIPGFEDGMIGIEIGSQRDIKVVFPVEYGNKELAGKDAVFKVKLIEIQEKDIPKKVDEEILKRFLPQESKPTEELFREQIKNQIQGEKQNKLYNEELKPKFIEDLVKNIDFDLPETIVEQEMDAQFRGIFRSISEAEMEEFKNNPDKVKEKRETFRNDAENSVKLTFLVDELARVNNINVSDQEVMQMVYFEAAQYGQDPKQFAENYKKQGILPAIKMTMIEEKLFRTLFKNASQKDENSKEESPKAKKVASKDKSETKPKTNKKTKTEAE